ncbi:MAG: calcium-binding protein, partial [Pseudomonadota bacterium]
AFGKGDDAMFNFGDVFGDVRMGGGDDFFINDTFQAGPLDLFGFVLGSVSMGSGDDVVLNGGSLGNVALGSGDDFYAAITPQSLLDNFDNPLVFASEIRAGSGSDTVYGGANDDVIFGQSGSDVLNGHNGNDRISGGNGKDTIRGGNGDDTLNGGAGKDELLGGNGDDTLLGGNGQDTLIGGRGDDEMSGGSGADTFILRSSISYGNIGNDTITDLRDGDSIVLYPNFFTLGADGKVPTISDELILSNITYGDGGTAVLDLHALFEVTGFAPLKNSSVTFENVNEGDIDADNFYTATDFLIDNPEVFIL